MHINDWAAIQTLFDKLNKQLEKTQKVGGASVGTCNYLCVCLLLGAGVWGVWIRAWGCSKAMKNSSKKQRLARPWLQCGS